MVFEHMLHLAILPVAVRIEMVFEHILHLAILPVAVKI